MSLGHIARFKLAASFIALLALPLAATTVAAAQTTYPIFDPNFKQIGSLTETENTTVGSCTNPQGTQSYYTQYAYTATSYQVNGVVMGGTLQGSGSLGNVQATYTVYSSGSQCSSTVAGWSTRLPFFEITLTGATLDGQSYFKVAYEAYFNRTYAYVTTTTLPIFNTQSTIIGSLGSGFANSSNLTCGSGTTYTESLFLLASWALDGTYNGNTFEGGGPLTYSGNNPYTDNYIQFTSAPTSGCPASGFVVTSSINLPFASSSNLYINGVKQSNPQVYSVEFNGVSSGNLQ